MFANPLLGLFAAEAGSAYGGPTLQTPAALPLLGISLFAVRVRHERLRVELVGAGGGPEPRPVEASFT